MTTSTPQLDQSDLEIDDEMFRLIAEEAEKLSKKSVKAVRSALLRKTTREAALGKIDEPIDLFLLPQAGPERQLAYLAASRPGVERTRVRTQVHLVHLARDGFRDSMAEHLLGYHVAVEDWVEQQIQDWTEQHPVWTEWGCHVRGVGSISLGAILSLIDIRRAKNVSSLWKFAGTAPGQRRQRGQKNDFNMTLKVYCWRQADVLIKSGGKFKALYDQKKAFYQRRCARDGIEIVKEAQKAAAIKRIAKKHGMSEEDAGLMVETEGHIHLMAMRFMIKVFLACVWKVWRRAEGLPVGSPWIIGQVDETGHLHGTEYLPEEFIDKP